MNDDSLRTLYRSLEDGHDTIQLLNLQKERLVETKNMLHHIEYSIKNSEKMVNRISSMFGSIKNWFSSKEEPSENEKVKRVKPFPIEIKETENTLTVASNVLDKLEEVATIINMELDVHTQLVEDIEKRAKKSNDKVKQLQTTILEL